MNLLSNLFRYASAMTVERLRVNTIQRMRDEMYSRVLEMNVGFFSDQRKGDIMSKITQDVMVVQYCITNTLQVAFRDPCRYLLAYSGCYHRRYRQEVAPPC